MFKKSFTAKVGAIVMVAALVFSAQVASAVTNTISVNFAGGQNNGLATGGTGEALVTGPAGVGQLGNWNNAVGTGQAGPIGLINDKGDANGTLTWNVGNTWTTNGSNNSGSAQDQALMQGYLDNFGGQTLTVTGIGDNESFDVLVYFNNDNNGGTRGFIGTDGGGNMDTGFGTQVGGNDANFPLAGPDGYIISDASTFGTATAANVVRLTGFSGDSFTLEGAAGGGDNRSRPNGFQIIATLPAVPEPTTAVLGLLGMAGLARRRRRLA